jgi:DNA-binding transcriptional LysR family regulator
MEKLLESRHLNAFVTIVRTGSMHRAGKVLSLTPSALSHAIKSLEDDLGVVLFERTGRSLVLTAAGTKLHADAEGLVRQLQEARERAKSAHDWRRGRLVIGSTSTGCQFIVPSVIREFKESFPGMALSLVEREADDLVERLLAGTLDLAVAPLLRDYRDLVQIDLAGDELGFLLHPLHPWARAGRVTREEIEAQRLILPESHSPTFELIDSYFREERIPLRPFIEIDNEEVVKQLVGLGIGVGCLPGWIAAREIEEGALVSLPMGRRPLQRRWMLFHRKGRQLSFPETLFIGVSEAVTRDLIAGFEDLAAREA